MCTFVVGVIVNSFVDGRRKPLAQGVADALHDCVCKILKVLIEMMAASRWAIVSSWEYQRNI